MGKYGHSLRSDNLLGHSAFMTKSDFISRQTALKSYVFKLALVYLAGLAGFMFWPEKKGPDGLDHIFVGCFFSYLFGGMIVFVWLQLRRRKQLGAFCPNCGKGFVKKSERLVIATGTCGGCGERILDDLPAA